MAGEDGQEKTEPASQKRRDDARREGKIPKSQELSGATLLIAGTASLALVGGASLARHANQLMLRDFSSMSADPLSMTNAMSLMQHIALSTLTAMAPFLIGVAGVTLLVNVVQARGVVAPEGLQPKLEHISPLSGFKRLFSMDALFNVLKALIKVIVIGWVAWLVLKRAWPEVLSTSGAQVPQVLGLTRGLAIRMALWVGLVYLIVAALDYGWQVWQFEKSIRMTKQEVVQEHKESDGDPHVKGRIRQLQRSLAKKRMMANVATADVVVTNPTHIAVALKYDPLVASAPIIVAMGERLVAQKIKEIAYKAGVPVMENKPLARALFASAEVGKPVPPALYVAVAEVIAFVFGRRNRPLPVGRNR
jgi:flagellar biosynthetic protein FlhB